MTAFDDAVRNDLAAAPQPASLDRLRQLARRRRSQTVMSGAVSLLIVVIGVALLVNQAYRPETVAIRPTISPTSAPRSPSTGTMPSHPVSVLAIGDSVMEGSQAALQEVVGGMKVDAAISRRFDQAVGVIDEYKRLGPLPSAIVIHLGDVDAALGRAPTAKTLDDLVNAIGPQSFVYVLTVHIPRTSEGAVNDALSELAVRRPNVHLLDWRSFAEPHPEWFVQDGFHLTESGQAEYAAFVRGGIDAAARCPGPPVTLPAGGQALIPVAVPCGCPSEAMTPIPQTDIARNGPITDAALRWIRHVNPKWRDAGLVSAVYVVGETSRGQFGQVYAQSVPKYCGQGVAEASYVVEMANPAENDTGREADVVVAHFASGWEVWGAYHP